MSEKPVVLHQVDNPNRLVFLCPGCKYGHLVTVNGEKNESGASWGWNGSMTAPTFTPSLLVNANVPGGVRCHSFVNDGKIQFLTDCDHELRGQTVDIPAWDDDLP